MLLLERNYIEIMILHYESGSVLALATKMKTAAAKLEYTKY
jgi:hypothetical protein